MRPEQQTTIPENPHMHISNFVLLCPIHNFNVVKQQNRMQQVNLCILNVVIMMRMTYARYMQFYESVGIK